MIEIPKFGEEGSAQQATSGDAIKQAVVHAIRAEQLAKRAKLPTRFVEDRKADTDWFERENALAQTWAQIAMALK